MCGLLRVFNSSPPTLHPSQSHRHTTTAIMSNAPDRFAFFMLGEGEKRVEVTEETTIENAVTVCLNKEDHTMGNLLRQ